MFNTRMDAILPALGLLLLTLAAPAAATEQDQELLFILDASGSMWGRVADRTKIEIAREALTGVLMNLPSGTSVGLMAYGHHRKGDCRDIEFLIRPQAGTRNEVAAALMELIPRGKTPIADALSQAGEYLKKTEKPATIVLVSDGIETCQGDPCRVAEALAASGVKLKIFVVGFDVGRHELAQLECVARKGGGRFFLAQDAGSLVDALTVIRKHVVESAPLAEAQLASAPGSPERPKAETEASSTTKIKIKGPGTIRLKPAPWVRIPPRTWSLIDAESGDTAGEGTGETIRVKAGLYQIVWRQTEHDSGPVALTETIPVESGETTEVPLDTGLRLTAPDNLAAPRYWRLLDGDQKVVAHFSGSQAFAPQLVPAGGYRLVWRQTEHGSPDAPLGPVEIATGKLKEIVLDTGFVTTLPEWLEAPYAYTLLAADGASYTFRETGVLPFAPGKYRLVWRQTEHGHSPVEWGTVTITQGEYSTLPINSGVSITPFGDKPPYRFIFRSLDTEKSYVLQESFGPMPLPPGRYAIDLHERQHGASPIPIVDELDLKAGTLLGLEM